MLDLAQSRRDYNEYCRFWTRNEDDKYEPDELVYKRIPSGSFWSKEVSPENTRNNVVGGTFMFDSTHITLKTPDNCEKLKSEDLVEFRDELWIVVSVQKSKARTGNRMFVKDQYCSHYWYIELRK